MGQFPASAFESFRVRVGGGTVPAWKVRLVMALASIVGLVVFVLLLPLILFVVILVAAWIAVMRLRLWLAGGRGGSPEVDAAADDGRENVRVLVRDA